MKILVSNDDGWQSPGIIALAESLATIAEAVVVAPDRNCSAASNALTLQNPLRVVKQSDNVFSVTGMPADCVNVALCGLLDFEPDMVVSGINDGPNLGDDVLYSGTVAAAMEGRGLRYPPVAFSLDNRASACIREVAREASRVVCELMALSLPKNLVLNVNFPACPVKDYQGIQYTRLGNRKRSEAVVTDTDPRGQTIYWIGPAGEPDDTEPGTDFHAHADNYITITPVAADRTDYPALTNLNRQPSHSETDP